MKTLEIELEDGQLTNGVKFATKLVAKACEFTSEEINIKTNEGIWVDLKSIMGVLTLNYNTAKTITIQIMGGSEDYAASSLERFIKKELIK